MEKTIETILQCAVTVLSVVGVLTLSEGTEVATYGAMTATGVIGLFSAIKAIVARRKEEKETKETK